jgi:hypothetical protein
MFLIGAFGALQEPVGTWPTWRLPSGAFFGELSLLSEPRAAPPGARHHAVIRRDVFAMMMQDDIDIVLDAAHHGRAARTDRASAISSSANYVRLLAEGRAGPAGAATPMTVGAGAAGARQRRATDDRRCPAQRFAGERLLATRRREQVAAALALLRTCADARSDLGPPQFLKRLRG